MVNIKSQREIELMREAGRITGLCHVKLRNFIKPGVTTKQIDAFVEKIILENNCLPGFKNLYGFPAATCESVNDSVVHGFPNNHKLKDGDIVSVDLGAKYKGYNGDSAWTYAVGKCSEETLLLLERTEKSLYVGLSVIHPGAHVSDIGHAIEEYISQFGYGIVEEYTGHGVGKDLHEDPAIPNYGHPGHGDILREGMCIAVEPMINMGTKKITVSNDGWTVKTKDKKKSAHFEHTVLVTASGCEILTKQQDLNNKEELL